MRTNSPIAEVLSYFKGLIEENQTEGTICVRPPYIILACGSHRRRGKEDSCLTLDNLRAKQVERE